MNNSFINFQELVPSKNFSDEQIKKFYQIILEDEDLGDLKKLEALKLVGTFRPRLYEQISEEKKLQNNSGNC